MIQSDVEILLVEDNPDDVELTLNALRTENIANVIQVARDGEEALDFIFCRGKEAGRHDCKQPQLVLLDLQLPKVNGLDVLREMKSDPLTQGIPVVVLTASREEKDLVAGYNLGVNAYIQKPVDWSKFNDTLKAVGMLWLVIDRSFPYARGAD